MQPCPADKTKRSRLNQ
uniref:Uncharacterized protein n=1 Tax=Rhizophora mucronata TaxID=61149 RepID=A0A2P2J593_RHIMU